MLEFLLAPVTAPFMVWSMLGFWWLLATGILVVGVQALVYIDNRNQDNEGDFAAALAVLCVVFLVVSWATTNADGFLLSAWEVLKKFVVLFLQYCIYGIVSVIPLWMLHARKNYERLGWAAQEFVKHVVRKNGAVAGVDDALRPTVLEAAKAYRSDDKDLPEDLVPAWREFRNDSISLRNAMRGTKPMENKWLLATFIFLWPFQIIDAVLGEVLYRFVRFVVTLMARLMARFTYLMKYGLPNNIDE